ncbi:MAG: ABC transporter substrate-binding protein [Acidimicrobiia bacterium]|nr:ABC transporter substrate-binding protein [Acidimicrobiia bacterium]
MKAPRWLVVVLALMMALAACGGDTPETGETGDTAAATEDPGSTEAETTEPAAGPTTEATDGTTSGPTTAGEASGETLRVGLAVSLSGAVADTGQKMLDGAQLWVDEGNTILDRPVELVVYDDESTPETSARLYDRLIATDQVDLLIGPYGSGPAAAVAEVADRHERFILMTGAAASAIFEGSEMSVQLMSPSIHQPALPLQLAAESGIETMAAAGVDNPYGREVQDGAIRYAEEYGIEVVHQEVYEEEPRDLSSLILSMRSKSPDLVYVGAYVPDSILFTRQAQEQGLEADMFVLGATGPTTPEFVESLGVVSGHMMGTAQWHPQAPYPGAAEFVELFESTHGEDVEVDYVHATGYAGMEVLSLIAADAGSLDDQALLEAAHAAEYETLYGGFLLDETGLQIAERGVVTQIQDGEIVPVWPEGSEWEPIIPAAGWNEL